MKAFVALALLLVLAAPATAESIKQPGERRCAFLGRSGAFIVTGSTGHAAYQLGNEKYIADLESAGTDRNWWLYRPVGNGDPSTTMWALETRPRGNMHRVLRFSNGRWRPYECTNAWGNFADGTATAQSFSVEVIDELRAIREKLELIQPADRPSLQDIQDSVQRAGSR